MDSRLDSLFRTTFRQTESTDTWMGIRRDEPRDDHSKKDKEEKDESEKVIWEDNMAVSIAALKQFLLSLLETQTAAAENNDALALQTAEEAEPLSLSQQKTHKAISAYQTTARHAAPPSADSAAAVPPPSSALSQEENREIYNLLQNLEALLQKGITSLTIQKEGSFLQSLRQSAQAALQEGED